MGINKKHSSHLLSPDFLALSWKLAISGSMLCSLATARENPMTCQCIRVNTNLPIFMAYLNTALTDLFSAYFVFDIAYPLAGVPILIFFQHYVFGLKDRQKIPDTQYPSLFPDNILHSLRARLTCTSIAVYKPLSQPPVIVAYLTCRRSVWWRHLYCW